MRTGAPPSGERALFNAIHDGLHEMPRRRGLSWRVIFSVAASTALALTISATGKGVDAKVAGLLDLPELPPQVDTQEILRTVNQAKYILMALAFSFTAIFVAAVSELALMELQRTIATKRQQGFHLWELATELLTMAVVLSTTGAMLGVGMGWLLCQILIHIFPAIPLHIEWRQSILVCVIEIFCGVIAIAFMTVKISRKPPSVRAGY